MNFFFLIWQFCVGHTSGLFPKIRTIKLLTMNEWKDELMGTELLKLQYLAT